MRWSRSGFRLCVRGAGLLGVAAMLGGCGGDAARVYGFEMTARLESNLSNGQAGDFTAGALQVVKCDNESPKGPAGCPANAQVQFITHTRPFPTNTIQVQWTAPATNVGNVRIYIAANAVNASNAVAPCTRLHPARLLETEVLGLQPLNLAVAFDDHRRALVLAAKHRFSHSSLEGFIDHSSVLAANSIDVFLRFRLHSVRDYRRD